MKKIEMYKKGEHVYLEMVIHKVKLVGDDLVYTLKSATEEDYLDKEYTFKQLIPFEEINATGEQNEMSKVSEE